MASLQENSYPPNDLCTSLEALSTKDDDTSGNTGDTSSMLYVPIVSPPTPAPSPRPLSGVFCHGQSDTAHISRLEFASLKMAGSVARQQYLASILADCTPAEILFVSTAIAPLLKRDFLHDLPVELSLHVLKFIDDPRTLARASQVSRFWNGLMKDDAIWKRMCEVCLFDENRYPASGSRWEPDLEYAKTYYVRPMDRPSHLLLQNAVAQPSLTPLPPELKSSSISASQLAFAHRTHFIQSYKTMTNWRRKGRLLNKDRPPSATPDGGVVTSVAIDHEWIVVGLANCRIRVFSARTGVHSRTLVGHESGVWAVNLVSAGGYLDEPKNMPTKHNTSNVGSSYETTEKLDAPVDIVNTPNSDLKSSSAEGFAASLEEMEYHIPQSLRVAVGLDKPRAATADMNNSERMRNDRSAKPSDICCASEGWGNPNALVVSGGCDKQLRVWDVKTGYCIYVLEGHMSTIRCLRVLHNRPIAISGSRDTTLRVWDVQRGKHLRTLAGHEESVRCLDVCGNKVVSGSYDCTCRLWNIDTGECLHVLRGHIHQIYSVAYDGQYIASGGLDTTVRVWNPNNGQCLALLQGHTALVCQLQLSGDTLATGGSDGRVITFSLNTMSVVRRIAAHDSSVTALQFDSHFLVTGGMDGLVRLYDAATGNFVRDLTQPAEAVWKVVHKYDKCVVMCKRAGKTVVEIWSFRPTEEDD